MSDVGYLLNFPQFVATVNVKREARGLRICEGHRGHKKVPQGRQMCEQTSPGRNTSHRLPDKPVMSPQTGLIIRPLLLENGEKRHLQITNPFFCLQWFQEECGQVG